MTAEAYARAASDPTLFWEQAAERLDWAESWHTAHEWDPPVGDAVPAARWFVGGRLNVAYNCVDRHVEAGRGDKVALHFEGEPGDRIAVTYSDLQDRVSRAANALIALGIRPGDRVVIYLPVLIETVVITLACARVGAVHSLVFGGFSAEAVRFRLADTGATLLVTSDGQLLGFAQVAVMVTVVALALRIQPVYGWATVLLLLLASAAFIAILQALNVWFGAVGEFLGLVLMLVQLVTAGGTFPWQTIPEPLLSVHRLLPMSYTVEGLRQTLYGGDLASAAGDAGVLAAWLVVALLATTVAGYRQRTWTPSRLKPELVL